LAYTYQVLSVVTVKIRSSCSPVFTDVFDGAHVHLAGFSIWASAVTRVSNKRAAPKNLFITAILERYDNALACKIVDRILLTD
jgi:hypothetical protein